MEVKSNLVAQSNLVVKHIKSVSVESTDITDIICIEFDCCNPVWIDTAKNTYARTRRALTFKEECQTQNGRHTIVLSIPECANNTRIGLYKLACIARDISENNIRDEYCGIHCNHKDRTGNKEIYGYSNNRLYNLELVSSQADEIHWHCIERLQLLTNKHFSISADNTEIINKCRELSDNELIDEANNWILKAEYDAKYDTYIIK